MNEAQVAETLRALDGGLVSPNRVRLLAELSEIYEGEGVLSAERAPALHRECPSADACWADARDRVSTQADGPWSGDQDGSIFWPWIGDQYKPGGVAVVGLNINHAGGWWSITEEYAIKADEFPSLESGRRAMGNHSMFAYRCAATVMAVLASSDGKAPIESPDPREAPAAFERVALLQAVKCSPLGDASRPTRKMCVLCPPRYMARELAVLKPGVVVTLGRDARWATEQAGDAEWETAIASYARGTLTLGEHRSQLFFVPHPAARRGSRWSDGQTALLGDLVGRPSGT